MRIWKLAAMRIERGQEDGWGINIWKFSISVGWKYPNQHFHVNFGDVYKFRPLKPTIIKEITRLPPRVVESGLELLVRTICNSGNLQRNFRHHCTYPDCYCKMPPKMAQAVIADKLIQDYLKEKAITC